MIWSCSRRSATCWIEQNRDLLRRAFQALAPGGRIVIQDHIMNADKTSPRAGALFAVNMLVGTAGGSTYSEDEYAQWLREAGFGRCAEPPPWTERSRHRPTIVRRERRRRVRSGSVQSAIQPLAGKTDSAPAVHVDISGTKK